jgi:hypothetical protein
LKKSFLSCPYAKRASLFGGRATRSRLTGDEGHLSLAEHDAREALSRYAGAEAYLGVPDSLEILAGLTADVGGHREAARLFGAADGIRRRTGEVRFPDVRRRIRGSRRRVTKCHG